MTAQSTATPAKTPSIAPMPAARRVSSLRVSPYAPAIGALIEGIDLSYYTNTDMEDGEVAIFLKRKLP